MAPKLFALNASRAYGEVVSRHLGMPLGEHEERDFEDGEHKTRPLESVRGADVHVLMSTHGDSFGSANDKLCRLLFFIGALKDAGAAAVTALVPYLCYARKDRKTKPRDPVTTRYVARLFEAVGTDRVVTLDVHNLAAFQNAFRCPTENLEARPLFVAHLLPLVRDAEVVAVSPDIGGIKRVDPFAEQLAKRLGRAVPTAFMDKKRSGGVVTGDMLVGDVAGKAVILLDDMISSGTTIQRAAVACRAAGAARVYGVASHGLFRKGAAAVVADPAFDRIIVTDTIISEHLEPALMQARVEFVPAAPLFAEAIRRLHTGGSVVDLIERGPDQASIAEWRSASSR